MDEIYKAIMDFLFKIEFTEKKKSNTIRSFRKDLLQLNEYLATNGYVTKIRQISEVTLRGFFYHLQKGNIGKRSIARKMSALRGFFRYLVMNGDIEYDPMEKIYSPDFKEHAPEILTPDDIVLLRQAIPLDSLNGYRDRLIIELLYSSGITSTELLGTSESSFDVPSRELMVYNGKNARLVFFSKTTGEIFEKYIALKKEKYKENYDNRLVFINSSGTKLSDRSLRRIISRYTERAGITKEVSPYTFRHTFATYLLSHGMSLGYLKQLMGHVSIESTLTYQNINK